MTKTLHTLLLLLLAATATAGGVSNIRLGEVMTANTASIVDEYNTHRPWVEIANTSYATRNIRGMYITTDRRALNPDLSAPQRERMMSLIPNGTPVTELTAKQHIVFFLGSTPARGPRHLTAAAQQGQPLWIALYDGNAVDLIDSITVPPLLLNTSYARTTDDADGWEVKAPADVTPGTANAAKTAETKTAKLKREDPYGIGITVMCMGIVFTCLALLYVFFVLFGYVADRRNKLARVTPIKPLVKTTKVVEEVRHAMSNILQDGLQTKGRDKEIYIAVIALALRQYLDDVHDVESGVLTIKPHETEWASHTLFQNPATIQ